MENIIFAVLVLGAIAIVFGLILSVAAKVFEVKVDERLPKIQECLAGANCGGCGYPGCAGCAEAILAGKAPVTACAPAGAEGAAKIAAIMGMEAPSGEKMVAHVICNGGDAAVKNFEYVGIADCVGALKVAGGPTACSFGCLGFGDCVAVCAFDAIHINLETGLPEVDEDKCTSCGACVKACPKNIIELRKKGPKSRRIFVSCVNKDKGGVAKKACANACIGCGKCAKECPFEAITVENNVAYIDYTKCRLCRKCVAVCPTGAIHELNFPPRKEAAPAVDADKIKPATAPKPAAPKADAPKTEAPKKESPKAEAPTANATPNAETPKIETKEETIQK